MRRLKTTLLAVLAGALITTPSLGGVLLIDSFSEHPIGVGNRNTATYVSDQTDLSPEDALGGARYLSATRTGTGTYSIFMADNSLGLFLNDASTMTWFLEYGRHTDLNLDLTQYTEVDGGDPEFHFNLFSDHSGATLNIKLTTAGGGFSTYNHACPVKTRLH